MDMDLQSIHSSSSINGSMRKALLVRCNTNFLESLLGLFRPGGVAPRRSSTSATTSSSRLARTKNTGALISKNLCYSVLVLALIGFCKVLYAEEAKKSFSPKLSVDYVSLLKQQAEQRRVFFETQATERKTLKDTHQKQQQELIERHRAERAKFADQTHNVDERRSFFTKQRDEMAALIRKQKEENKILLAKLRTERREFHNKQRTDRSKRQPGSLQKLDLSR